VIAYNVDGAELMGDNVKQLLRRCGEGVRLMPLAKIAKPEVVELDDYCRVRDFVFLWGGQGIKIGKYCDIQPHVVVWGGGVVEIGDRVSIGPGSVLLTAIYTHEEGHTMVDGLPEGSSVARLGLLSIGNDVYIGANCTLMPDIKIGDGAVVGAGSFVNKDLDPLGIYVGSPAKKIAERSKIVLK
jgi:acetyltransferase-like isoleucine patch superfamily enzyme